ncbi:MAG: indole-3-glycerol phosphate synthase TrpC [Fimbriimonadaceae bacterium]|nr:indole-3-glycerol phosphate synthase TrpC [Fimbriimonadaceae bacterium]
MNLLDEILAYKRSTVEERQLSSPLADIKRRIADQELPRGFHAALKSAGVPVALIAEVKPGSPSRGVIRDNLDPAALAQVFEKAGAHCLSVLTDVRYFRARPENLELVRNAVGLPCLRKDFVVHEYDVWESRAMGADAVLLIANGLDDAQLRSYREVAEGLGMDALVEVHSETEAKRAIASGASLIGVNNRDLESFETSVAVGECLLPQLAGQGLTLVSESALTSYDDVRRVAAAGAHAVLIGTAFCEAQDPGAKVREVMAW